MVIKKQDIPLLTGCAITAMLFVFTMNNGFFWDTIQLGSKHANYYFIHDFSGLLLPDSIDSGHIPAFGMYLAVIWKIFGRNILVSHLAMVPFILGILWQLYALVRKLIGSSHAGWAFLLILIDPTLLSQITLVSPDVALVFFFLLGLNSIMDNSVKIISVSVVFLFLTSMRGMMVAFCLLIMDLWCNVTFTGHFKSILILLIKRSRIYIPALLIFISYSYYHYHAKGWIGFHEDSPWAESFERIKLIGILFNMGILGWRLVDFGRIGIWMVFFILLHRFKADMIKTRESRMLLFLCIVLMVFLSLNLVWAKNLLAHRYLLPVYLSFSMLCATLLFTLNLNIKRRKALISLWLLLLITGNLWVYPDKIAQGWDATLAHLPYYQIRQQTMEYLDQQNIDFRKIQSFFPNVSVIDDVDLNHDQRKFSAFNQQGDYVVYSNVFNISNEDYDLIKNNYQVIRRFKKGFLYMDVCKRYR